ncbi:hypothetical protein [Maritimibacter sp. HL-12]|uniref:hypothetical protein n=1 Tax=Maritimibacter sp. HL-12 TaxID=1162418 RepID=UPI000A1CD56F|nr:hypothetical protein [Maritimibacter sp. HL-12]
MAMAGSAIWLVLCIKETRRRRWLLRSARGSQDKIFPRKILVRLPCTPYIWSGRTVRRKGCVVSDTGLQKLAFFLLVALILYVSITGGV